MKFFIVLEVTMILLLIIAVVSQIIVPAVKGTKLFPLFDKRKKLKNEIVELKTRKEEMSLQHEIKNERKHINESNS